MPSPPDAMAGRPRQPLALELALCLVRCCASGPVGRIASALISALFPFPPPIPPCSAIPLRPAPRLLTLPTLSSAVFALLCVCAISSLPVVCFLGVAVANWHFPALPGAFRRFPCQFVLRVAFAGPDCGRPPPGDARGGDLAAVLQC